MVPLQLFDSFSSLKALIVGDPILDSFLDGVATRLCVESPVPVILRQSETDFPGGAANTAANVASLGAEARLVGLTGDDPARERLAASLDQYGVDPTRLVADPRRATTHKVRVVAGGQYIARIDDERTPPSGDGIRERLLEEVEKAFEGCDLVLVSDYSGGSADRAVMERLEQLRERRQVPLVIDSKNLLRHAGVRATLVTPNLGEASALAGMEIGGDPAPDPLERLAGSLLERVNAERVAITAGAGGVYLRSRGEEGVRLAAPSVGIKNEVGAGDSFAAATALALAAGADPVAAARLGMEAAAVAVSKPRTAVASAAELRERLMLLASAERRATRVGEVARLAEKLEDDRRRSRRIVFTNGVFDLFHQGHLALLRRAAQLGDVLVVAVNSDRGARSLKGSLRPINPEAERVAVVGGLDCVDHVVLFDSATASELVLALRPDVYVKGDDHDELNLPEADAVRAVGARLVILPRLGSLSTSRIIDRILADAATGSPSVPR